MSNELNIPIGGIGPEGAFTVECLGQAFTICYVVNIRTGADIGIVVDTIKHFKHAIQCLAIGGKKPSKNVGERDTYSDKIEHGESRANVWTFRSFAVVPVGDKIFKVPINLCNEFTDAATLINWVWLGVVVMNSEDMVDDFIQAGSIISPGAYAPKAKSELDKHFPRGADGKPVSNDTPPIAPQRTDYQAAPPEVVDLVNYDYNQQLKYEDDYIGRTVCFNVSKVSRDMEVKKDKSSTYECLNIWGYWDGLPSDNHPMYSFRMFAPKPEQKYGDWLTFFKTFETGELSEPGLSVARPMRFYYKLANGKGDNANKVYWNLRKWEFLTDEVSTPQPVAKHEGDEMPF